MSFYLYDANGYLADGPSIVGMEQFSAWAQDDPVLRAFCDDGYTIDITALIDALRASSATGNVDSSRLALLAAAEDADDVLIVSDGIVEDDSLETLGSVASGNFGHAGRPGKVGGSSGRHTVYPQTGDSPTGGRDSIPQATTEGQPFATDAKGRPAPNILIQQEAQEYNALHGMPPIDHTQYIEVDQQRAGRIADAYDALPMDDSKNPAVQKSYEALAREVNAQWDHAVKHGMKFEPDKSSTDAVDNGPYKSSFDVTNDIRNNRHLFFFTGGEPNRFMAIVDPKTGYTVNDKFRAIHDYFGHAAGGYGFGPRGEENAWSLHSQMFSPEARRALTTETRGQNSWVNFGRHNYDKHGNYLYTKPADRPYAPQKTALLPEEFSLRTLIGTETSGNFGHVGRPGVGVGGSGHGLPNSAGILATINKPDGGFTYDPVTGESPTSGYAVSHPGHEHIIDAGNVDDVALEVAKYAKAHWDFLKESGNYMGGWHNPADNKIYLDVSTVTQNRADAERIARHNHQIAFFDLLKGESVTVEGGTHVIKTNVAFDGTEGWPASPRGSGGANQGVDGEGSESSSDREDETDYRGLIANGETLIHQAADNYIERLKVTIRYAFAQGRIAVHARQLQDVQNVSQGEAVMSAAPYAVRDALQELLPKILMQIVVAGGQAGVELLPERAALQTAKNPLRAALVTKKRVPVKIKVKFDNTNEAAIQWVREHALELAEGISDTSRKNIKRALVDAFSGEGKKNLRKVILAAVGDEDRADTIARSETMKAASEGQRFMWRQAVKEGLLSGREKKRWIATPDERVCPICSALDGKTTRLDGSYPDPGGFGPPVHVVCRCSEGVGIKVKG